ncbi:MAG: 3-dehydroquinate synthase [Lachnospirales bacterium]
MELSIKTNPSYNIKIGKNILENLKSYVEIKGKVMIVTDGNIHKHWYHKINFPHDLIILPDGENTKSFHYVETIMKEMLKKNYTREDTLVAFGGGVIGDLTGFVASMYMRGIDFIQIPTTLLSQVDSSVGGKTAINFSGHKNIVGAFYQPKFVLIDTNTLTTLDERQFNNGMAEIIKYGCILDLELFNSLKKPLSLEKIIYRCLELKGKVVEADEKEKGLRKILNFGHTIGHGIESFKEYKLFHGECVAIGMASITTDLELKKEIIRLLDKYNLPTTTDYNKDEVFKIIQNDKKAKANNEIDIIVLEEIGKCKVEKVSIKEIYNLL